MIFSILFTAGISLCILYLIHHIYRFLQQQHSRPAIAAGIDYKNLYEDLLCDQKQKSQSSSSSPPPQMDFESEEEQSMLEDITQEVFQAVSRENTADDMQDELSRLVYSLQNEPPPPQNANNSI